MITSSFRRSRVRLGLALASVFALTVAACGNDSDSDTAPSTTAAAPTTAAPAGSTTTVAVDVEQCDTDATLTWGYGDQIRDWDPHDSPAGQDQWYLMAVYDRLFHQAPDGTTLPGLVEEWSFSDDALTITMKLRSGVTFHDGTPLTADIVAQNLQRSRGALNAPEGQQGFRSSFAADLRSVRDVAVVDPVTVEIRTSTPNVALPNILSDRPGMMIHPSTFDGAANDKPIGTGPFMLESFTTGDGGQAVLTKFDGYWDAENIKIAGLVMKDIRDSAARFNAVRAGNIDGARIDPVDYDAASKNADLTVTLGDTVEVIWFNMDVGIVPELGDVRVRQAMSLAIDRKAIVDSLAYGLGTPTATHMPPFYYAASPKVGVPSADVNAAKALMAEAGVTGFAMPILAGSTQNLTGQVSQAVAAMLGQIGITINVEIAGDNLANRLYFDRDGGGVVGPWSGRADPAQTIANILGPGFVNIAKTSVSAIDALVVQATAAIDPAQRTGLLHQIDELAAQNHVSGIALFSPKTIFATKKNITGLDIYVQGKHEFRNACVLKG